MKRQVLVLCTGNSCRSQMAEAIINAERGGEWEAYSAGTHPEAEVNPMAIRALAEIGIGADELFPKHVEEFIGIPFDLVLTVCDNAAQACPTWIGQGKKVHIGFPDPAVARGTEEQVMPIYRTVRDNIQRQVLALLDSINFAAV